SNVAVESDDTHTHQCAEAADQCRWHGHEAIRVIHYSSRHAPRDEAPQRGGECLNGWSIGEEASPHHAERLSVLAGRTSKSVRLSRIAMAIRCSTPISDGLGSPSYGGFAVLLKN